MGISFWFELNKCSACKYRLFFQSNTCNISLRGKYFRSWLKFPLDRFGTVIICIPWTKAWYKSTTRLDYDLSSSVHWQTCSRVSGNKFHFKCVDKQSSNKLRNVFPLWVSWHSASSKVWESNLSKTRKPSSFVIPRAWSLQQWSCFWWYVWLLASILQANSSRLMEKLTFSFSDRETKYGTVYLMVKTIIT